MYYAAAVMVSNAFYMGTGDSSAIIKSLIKQGDQYPDVRGKLSLAIQLNFLGSRLYQDRSKAGKQMVPYTPNK